MTNRILDFISILRKGNIRISISESIDACNSLCILKDDIFDKEIFKQCLKSSLIKDIKDEELFDQIFDLYFIEPIEKDDIDQLSDSDFENMWNEQMNNPMDQFDDIENNSQQDMGNSPDIDENFFNKINNIDKDQMIKDMYLRGSESEIEQFSKDQVDRTDVSDCKDLLSVDQIVDAIMNKNKMDLIKKNTKDQIPKSKEKNVDEKYQEIREKIKQQLQKKMVEEYGSDIIYEMVESEDLMNKDLAELTFDQLEQVQEIVKKMAKKIMTKQSRKEKESKKGRINIKSTIRHSISNGTTCSELRFRKRKNTKNDLVVLCDISGSVWLYVNFMLQMTIGIQKAFNNVESYVFVDSIKNINYMMDMETEQISNEIEKILFSNKLGVATDYTNSFIEFLNEENILNNKTILIVMGDAENTNQNDKGFDQFREITRKCKATFWLNPKEREVWYNGISCLEEYEKSCTDVIECSTIKQLEIFIKNIVRIK